MIARIVACAGVLSSLVACGRPGEAPGPAPSVHPLTRMREQVGAKASATPSSSSQAVAPAPSTAPSQAASAVPAPPVPAPPAPSFACPEGMVAIDGTFCTNLQQICLRKRKPWQCAEFEKPSRCIGKEKPMRYCIDRYEYPNKKGGLPTVMNSWRHAKKTCEGLGKRLCTENEWSLACEGPDRLPFPYGYARSGKLCPIDKPSPRVNERRLFNRSTQAAEIARLDQRERSGTRTTCVSPYGVHDLTGNVDEWVFNETRRPYRSALKGGNWGEYRNACRPVTRGHDEGFQYYQTGFRCCADPPAP